MKIFTSVRKKTSNSLRIEDKENPQQIPRKKPERIDKTILAENHENQIVPPQGICKDCFRHKGLVARQCGHRSCFECNKDLEQRYEFLCWICFLPLDGREVYQKPKDFSNFQIKIPKLQCKICTFDYFIEDLITLECDHRFCKRCIIKHIHLLVTEKKVNMSEFCCPECPEFISPHIIQAHCLNETYEKYNNLVFEMYKPESPQRKVIQCPSCGHLLDFDANSDMIICGKCKTKFCQYCKNYHERRTCEEKMIKTAKVVDFSVKKCPNCGEIGEKATGCNYVQCPLPGCRTHYCYLCLKPLSKAEHSSHFPDGSYYDVCNTLAALQSQP